MFESWLCLWFQLPGNAHLESSRWRSQAVESMLPMWETKIGFPSPRFGLACLCLLGFEPAASVCLCASERNTSSHPRKILRTVWPWDCQYDELCAHTHTRVHVWCGCVLSGESQAENIQVFLSFCVSLSSCLSSIQDKRSCVLRNSYLLNYIYAPRTADFTCLLSSHKKTCRKNALVSSCPCCLGEGRTGGRKACQIPGIERGIDVENVTHIILDIYY